MKKQLFTLIALITLCLIGCKRQVQMQSTGNAMLPTIPKGSDVIVDKGVKSFDRGDIVVFSFPNEIQPERASVNRIVAIAGDTVCISNSSLLVNGEPISYQSIATDYSLSSLSFKYRDQPSRDAALASGSLKVSDGHVFLVGDNPKHSLDSRHWGALPLKNILGLVSTDGNRIEPPLSPSR
jgi:signal peptidase I